MVEVLRGGILGGRAGAVDVEGGGVSSKILSLAKGEKILLESGSVLDL